MTFTRYYLSMLTLLKKPKVLLTKKKNTLDSRWSMDDALDSITICLIIIIADFLAKVTSLVDDR